MLVAHTSHIPDNDDDMSEGGCQSETVTLACVIAQEHHADARSHLLFPMCNPYLVRYMGFHVRSRM